MGSDPGVLGGAALIERPTRPPAAGISISLSKHVEEFTTTTHYTPEAARAMVEVADKKYAEPAREATKQAQEVTKQVKFSHLVTGLVAAMAMALAAFKPDSATAIVTVAALLGGLLNVKQIGEAVKGKPTASRPNRLIRTSTPPTPRCPEKPRRSSPCGEGSHGAGERHEEGEERHGDRTNRDRPRRPDGDGAPLRAPRR